MLLTLAAGLPSPGWTQPAPLLESSAAVAEAGSYRLHWSGEGRAVELQEAPTAAFSDPRTLYRGTDAARVISGRGNGVHHYRARYLEPAGPWSAPVRVEVRHHALGKALGFFGVGALVFLATAALIVSGGRRRDHGHHD